MEHLEKITTFPRVNELSVEELFRALGGIISDQTQPDIFRSDARKCLALLQNLRRESVSLSMISVLMALSSYSIGRNVAKKLIFYSSKNEYYLPMKSNFSLDVEMLEPKLAKTKLNSCNYSPKLLQLAKSKGLKLPMSNK